MQTLVAVLIASTLMSVRALPGSTRTPAVDMPAPFAQRINACALLPKEEVKKHLPWAAALDRMPLEEEPIGTTGSSCEYPSVGIQVLSYSPSMIQTARQKGGLETVSGLGDEAYFHNNANLFAELYVRVGQRLLTLQAGLGVEGNVTVVKPKVVNLAKAIVPKLR